MIIGNGSIAKLLNDREGFVFFASGESNSSALSMAGRIREHGLLGEWLGKSGNRSMFVYFSTISVFTNDSFYVKHKRNVEETIKECCAPYDWNYTIIRLGNVWECTNPNTFINAYNREPYEPRDEYKFMISKEQLNFITDNLPRTGKHEISIFGEMLKVKDCLERAKVMSHV